MCEHITPYVNFKCKVFPCHKLDTEKGYMCNFCYCPLYHRDCTVHGGTPELVESASGKLIKDCSHCYFPHDPANGDKIVKILGEEL